MVEIGYFVALTLGQQRWLRTPDIEHHRVFAGTDASMASGISPSVRFVSQVLFFKGDWEEAMRTATAFALLAVATICGGPAPAVAQTEPRPPIAIVQRIPLPGVFGRMDHMSLLRGAGIAVAALGNNSVEMVDGSTKVIASIPGQDMPQGVRYVPEIDKLFVANGGASKHRPDVRVYTGDTYQPVKSFDSDFEGADNIRYDPTAKLLYVSYEQGLATINTTTLERLPSNYKFPEHPESTSLEGRASWTSSNRSIPITTPESAMS